MRWRAVRRRLPNRTTVWLCCAWASGRARPPSSSAWCSFTPVLASIFSVARIVEQIAQFFLFALFRGQSLGLLSLDLVGFRPAQRIDWQPAHDAPFAAVFAAAQLAHHHIQAEG